MRICEYNVTLKKFNEGSRAGTVDTDYIEQKDPWGDTVSYTVPIGLEPKLRKELWEVLDKGFLVMRIFGETPTLWRES